MYLNIELSNTQSNDINPYTYSYVGWFKECSYVYRDEDGKPTDTVYLYECHKFPGHYIRWYCGEDTVDCEVASTVLSWLCVQLGI